MGRLRIVIIAGLAILAAVAAVLWVISRGSPGRTVPAASTADPGLDWQTFTAEVSGVAPGPDEYTVIVRASVLAGRIECARDLRIEQLTEQQPDAPRMIWANVVYTSPRNVKPGDCPDRVAAEVPLRSSAPLGDRRLALNSFGPVWAPAGGTYRQCDQTLGCDPPADHCASVWIDQVVLGLDVPVKNLHGVRDVLGCDGTWLVLDLNRAVGQCPPLDGKPTCSVPDQTTHLFLRWGDRGWETIVGTKAGGCAAVQAAAPRFPTALCANLPALG